MFIRRLCQSRDWEIMLRMANFFCTVIDRFTTHLEWRRATLLFLMAMSAWIFETISFALVALSLDIHLAVDESIFVMCMATLSTLLPSTPAYIGTFDYLCKLALMLVAVEENSATAATLMMHATNILPITAIGLLAFLAHFGRKSISVLIRRV